MRSALKLVFVCFLVFMATLSCGRINDSKQGFARLTQSGQSYESAPAARGAFQSRIYPLTGLAEGPSITPWHQPLEVIAPASISNRSPSNLYVVLSGNGSCPKGYPSRVAPGLQENELFMAFNRWIYSGGVLTANDRVIYACYEWQSPQMKFYDLKAERRMLPILETQIPELVVTRMQGFGKIFIVGHSHAGWLAMKLASSQLLLTRTTVPIFLASIDPVSRVTCQRLREPGCREAPRDFTSAELHSLNTRTSWINLFHQPAVILGSGPMAAAHRNYRVNANHVAMQTDATVWHYVRQFFQSNR
jgi:hypothetical protein